MEKASLKFVFLFFLVIASAVPFLTMPGAEARRDPIRCFDCNKMCESRNNSCVDGKCVCGGNPPAAAASTETDQCHVDDC
ncbi:hypothetical protein OWV82_016818 [Melia azedarach]|uniref:Uncharacterized protein n=1 Tax=Melia azedarach TaxID=155640 RepID=A0ACC1XGL7_MELAZ|nr:hypothetical protein OWV82_016818 [Melia azedarach]